MDAGTITNVSSVLLMILLYQLLLMIPVAKVCMYLCVAIKNVFFILMQEGDVRYPYPSNNQSLATRLISRAVT